MNSSYTWVGVFAFSSFYWCFFFKLLLFERSSEWVCGFEYLSSYDFSEIMFCGKALTWTARHTCSLLIFFFDFFSLKAFISSTNSNGRRLTLRIWDNSKQTAGKCINLLSMRFKALPWAMWQTFSFWSFPFYFFFSRILAASYHFLFDLCLNFLLSHIMLS